MIRMIGWIKNMLRKRRSSLLNRFEFTDGPPFYTITNESLGMRIDWMFESDRAAAEAGIRVFKAIEAESNSKLRETFSV